MILLIDNYDSFSYNLYQLLGKVGGNIKVIRNDEMTVDEIEELDITAIVLSPGPGRPEDAGVCTEVIKRFAGRYPILGVCLGHQAICQAFGGDITYAKQLMHGRTSMAALDRDTTLFKGMKAQIQVARYHSLAADEKTLPDCLKITARTDADEIMAVEHKEFPIYGLQFHPESILTPDGEQIIKNYITSIA